MTAKTTVTITEAQTELGELLAYHWVTVRLVHGGQGGVVDGQVIGSAGSAKFQLDDEGSGSFAVYPNAAITPAGTYYAVSVDGTSPLVARLLNVPTSGPVDWADEAIQVDEPSPPTTVPAPTSGDAFDVLRVDAAGTRYELAPAEVSAENVDVDGTPVLLHQSWQVCEDGPIVTATNGEGAFGAVTILDAHDVVAELEPATVTDGALRVLGDVVDTYPIVVAAYQVGGADSWPAVAATGRARFGFMFAGFEDAADLADLGTDDTTPSKVEFIATDGDGNGYICQLATFVESGVLVSSLNLGRDIADVPTLDDHQHLARPLVAGDVIEMEWVEGVGEVVVNGYLNGTLVSTITDTTSVFSLADVVTAASPLDCSLVDTAGTWRPGVFDFWVTTGDAWHPGVYVAPVAGSVSDATPQPLGVAAAGVSAAASRADHVHVLPDAGDVGADPAGTATSAVSAHAGATDPHGDRAYTDTQVTAAMLSGLPWPDRARVACVVDYPSTPSSTWLMLATAALGSGYAITADTNDQSFTYARLPLRAGTYSLRFIRRTGSSSGIATFTLGGSSVGTVDGYSATNVNDVISTITGITVAADGFYDLVVTNPAKHPSSSNYRIQPQVIDLYRTGA